MARPTDSPWPYEGLIEWQDATTAYLSVVFSWHLPAAYQRAVFWREVGYRVRAGGPAVTLNPAYLADVAEIGGSVPALARHNPQAMFTTRGCPNHCPFCAVPRLEGALVELDDWQENPQPVICDNNLLAARPAHFDRVLDTLLTRRVAGVDFNQGLDGRLLTDYHAARIYELHRAKLLKYARLAWDNTHQEASFQAAYDRLRTAGVPGRSIHVYALIGYNDTPADALYRLETVYKLGSLANPMRYQPLGALQKNAYVAPGWSEKELQDYMQYWSRRIYQTRDFAAWRPHQKGPAATGPTLWEAELCGL